MVHHPAFHDAQVNGLTRTAFTATMHCLAGCAAGEVAGLVTGSALGWPAVASIVLGVALAFVGGYALTMTPMIRAGLPFNAALAIALVADSLSLTIMAVAVGVVMLLIPGAMTAPLVSPLFWGSLGLALMAAAVLAYPANRWMIARGRGPALPHGHHGPH